MKLTLHLMCTCMSLVYFIRADDFKLPQSVSRMQYATIHRDVDTAIIANTYTVPTLVACAAKCTTQLDSASLYFIEEDRLCHCNSNTDVSTENDINKPAVTYGYFDQLAKWGALFYLYHHIIQPMRIQIPVPEYPTVRVLFTNDRYIEGYLLFDSFQTQAFKDDDEIRKWHTVPLRSDCLDLHNDGFSSDGVYTIQPAGQEPVDTWCDMQNGGWTVFQRRLDGSEDFYRDWSDYVSGFGNRTGEFWLGLDNIHALTTNASELDIYMETFPDKSPPSAYARYSSFTVDGPTLNYALHVGGFTGSCGGDSLMYENNSAFSTFDRDNDIYQDSNCAADFKAGWWYEGCHTSHLNGHYYHGEYDSFADGVLWKFCWGYDYSLKTTVMKLRRI